MFEDFTPQPWPLLAVWSDGVPPRTYAVLGWASKDGRLCPVGVQLDHRGVGPTVLDPDAVRLKLPEQPSSVEVDFASGARVAIEGTVGVDTMGDPLRVEIR